MKLSIGMYPVTRLTRDGKPDVSAQDIVFHIDDTGGLHQDGVFSVDGDDIHVGRRTIHRDAILAAYQRLPSDDLTPADLPAASDSVA